MGAISSFESKYSCNPSADGSRIVFEADRRIWIADADGRNSGIVAGVQEWMWTALSAFPTLTPDGTEIAYFLPELGPKGDLWAIAATGGETD